MAADRLIKRMICIFAAGLLLFSGCRAVEKESDKTLQAAFESFQKGNYEEAIGAYRLAISQGASGAKVYADMALAYLKNGDPAEAAEALKTAKERGKDDPDVCFREGLYYRELKDWEKALSCFEQAMPEDPDKVTEADLPLYGYRAEMREKTGDYDGAIEDCQFLIARGFHKTDEKILIGSLYLKESQVRAACTYYDWAEEDGLSPKQYLVIYRALEGVEEFMKAEAYFQRGIASAGASSGMTIGEYYAEAEKFASAEEYLKDETSFSALMAKASLATADQRYEEAETYLNELIRNGEYLPEVYNRYFILAARKGDFDLAKQLLSTLKTYTDNDIRKITDWNEVMMYELELDYKTAHEKLSAYRASYGKSEETERELAFLSRALSE